MPRLALLDETAARQVVLLEAIETSDPGGALLAHADRERADGEALERIGHVPGQRVDAPRFLAERAHTLLAQATRTHPKLAALQRPAPWLEAAGWLLPLLALAFGFASDRLGNPRELDLLSLPLLGVVLWNFVAYAWLVVMAVVPDRGGNMGAWSARALQSWRPGLAAGVRRVADANGQGWARIGGALEGLRVQRAWHLAAAAWAFGLVLSIAWTGLAREYRVGWESTWLDAGQVHALVALVAWPGRMLAGLDGFTVQQVEALNFRWGPAPGQAEGRMWALLYIAFLLCTVVLPRILLALVAAWRATRLARAIPVPLEGTYFGPMLARLNPLQIQLVLDDEDTAQRAAALCVVQQACAPGSEAPWLRTPKGDVLQVADAAGDAASEVLRVRMRDLPSWPGAAACWALEARLRADIVALAPEGQRVGADRLAQAWAQNHRVRWERSVSLLAAALARAARDAETIQGWWPGGKARETARTALLERLVPSLDALHRDLIQLHRVDAFAPAARLDEQGNALDDYLHKGTASAAGAVAGMAAGALAGAKIDLLTGGLTMGGGAAVGALVGGAGALGAARFVDLGGTVRLADDQLQALAEAMVLQYIAVIHAGRQPGPATAQVPVAWRREAVDAMVSHAGALAAACKLARAAADEPAAADAMRAPLRAACMTLLRNLYPGRELFSGAT